jgi:hypothetical protein
MSCPDCFSGAAHEGTPRGKMITLHGLETYVSEPADDRPVKGIIVIIPDAFGLPFVNNKILADHYADKGNYRVYLPDFMLGERLFSVSNMYKTVPMLTCKRPLGT